MNREELAEVRNQVLGFVFQSFHLLSRTSATENVATTQMNARNHAPIGDCENEWIELINPLRVRNVPKIERQKASATSAAFQTRSMFFFSCTITEWRNAVAASQGIRAAFSTGSQA